MTDQFVADGGERLRRALELKFRSEIEREFAVQLTERSEKQRVLIRKEMEREFARRLGNAMPSPETLY